MNDLEKSIRKKSSAIFYDDEHSTQNTAQSYITQKINFLFENSNI